MENKQYTLGIDIGSTTVKIAILDNAHNILFSDYKRHFANIRETLHSLLSDAYSQLGNIRLHPMITGSGGLTLIPVHIIHDQFKAKVPRNASHPKHGSIDNCLSFCSLDRNKFLGKRIGQCKILMKV